MDRAQTRGCGRGGGALGPPAERIRCDGSPAQLATGRLAGPRAGLRRDVRPRRGCPPTPAGTGDRRVDHRAGRAVYQPTAWPTVNPATPSTTPAATGTTRATPNTQTTQMPPAATLAARPTTTRRRCCWSRRPHARRRFREALSKKASGRRGSACRLPRGHCFLSLTGGVLMSNRGLGTQLRTTPDSKIRHPLTRVIYAVLGAPKSRWPADVVTVLPVGNAGGWRNASRRAPPRLAGHRPQGYRPRSSRASANATNAAAPPLRIACGALAPAT